MFTNIWQIFNAGVSQQCVKWLLNSGFWKDDRAWVDGCPWQDGVDDWILSLSLWVDSGVWKDNSKWLDTSTFTPLQATGGTETQITQNNVTYKVHTFTAPGGTFLVTSTSGNAEVECLVVGGGGGGGGVSQSYYSYAEGGGGGAGGFKTGFVNIASPGSYQVIVGQGGNGGAARANDADNGTRGGNSSALGLTSQGGGYGGSAYNTTPYSLAKEGGSGGSGGGGGGYYSAGGGTGTAGEGFSGGAGGASIGTLGGGGGGGGAGGPGESAADYSRDNVTIPGGRGITSNITGSDITYSIGGSCGVRPNISVSYGRGGFGGRATSNTLGAGAGVAGTDGIVIIRYPIIVP